VQLHISAPGARHYIQAIPITLTIYCSGCLSATHIGGLVRQLVWRTLLCNFFISKAALCSYILARQGRACLKHWQARSYILQTSQFCRYIFVCIVFSNVYADRIILQNLIRFSKQVC